MKILVIGDSCTDTFVYGTVNRLAPEAPIPIINPTSKVSNSGMAGNVVRNLNVLGASVDFTTNDSKIEKVRYVCSKYNHLLLRVDENDKCERISKNTLEKIDWSKYYAVVISDYCKGFLTEEDIEYISKRHSLVFLDTKKILGEWAHNISFIKINYQEYLNNKHVLDNDSTLLYKTIITRGKYGCDYRDKNYPTKEVPVKDVSGAGDTFLAGLVHNYSFTRNIDAAIEFAQECTTIVIQKSGVSTI